MSEDDYIEAISESWEWPTEALALADQAVREHPQSAELWAIRGDVLQLVSFETNARPLPLSERLRSYERAVEIDPDYAEAHEEIGYCYDVYGNDLEDRERAAAAFRTAISLFGGMGAYFGLARVLAQMHEDAEALTVLDECPYYDDPEIVELRDEIATGFWS